jgi:hypothetical protein
MDRRRKPGGSWPFTPPANSGRDFGGATGPVIPGDPQNLARTTQLLEVKNFPLHLYPPRGSITVDMRNVESLLAGTSSVLLRWQVPLGMRAFFTGYGIYTDAALAANIEFIPKVNGNRIFPFHGYPDPVNGIFRMDLGVAPDLGNEALVQCQLDVLPGQVLTWEAFNNAAVASVMGVRMQGYITSGENEMGRFGG